MPIDQSSWPSVAVAGRASLLDLLRNVHHLGGLLDSESLETLKKYSKKYQRWHRNASLRMKPSQVHGGAVVPPRRGKMLTAAEFYRGAAVQC